MTVACGGLLIFSASLAEENVPPLEVPVPHLPAPEPAPQPWVGLSVQPLSGAMRAHVPDLPEGVGFLVGGVDAEGPADRAGLRRFDILWKFEDQLLINEAQFATLIRMKAPGEEVALTVVRRGKTEVLPVELGKAPPPRLLAQLDPTDIPIIPSSAPTRVIYPGSRAAEVTRADGSHASLRYEDDKPVVHIEDAEGEVIFDGPLWKDGEMAVPEPWRCTVGALVRGMHRARGEGWERRAPRPRVVSPPESEPAPTKDEPER